ncbi:hypothetical protein C1H46_020416 [Malus baccata]|uniref:Tim10-like domain-containing protein n=4 Tax=Rosales TaxID=3744 RepID=A0A540M5I7_MALBA|nr:hypothetical protein C1H46_020416 [Malus baccata]
MGLCEIIHCLCTKGKREGINPLLFGDRNSVNGLCFRLSRIHGRLTPKTLIGAVYLHLQCDFHFRLLQPQIRHLKPDLMAAPNEPTVLDKEQIFGMAEKEMEYRVELFNKLTHTCFNKCVEKKYKESELNMGENSCIDRCVSKYWHVTNLVGQLLGSGRPPM